MTLYEFNHLAPAEQIRLAAAGTCLAHRWDGGGLSLHHVAGRGKGFYVEVCYDPRFNSLEIVRSSVSSALLDAYSLPAVPRVVGERP